MLLLNCLNANYITFYTQSYSVLDLHRIKIIYMKITKNHKKNTLNVYVKNEY